MKKTTIYTLLGATVVATGISNGMENKFDTPEKNKELLKINTKFKTSTPDHKSKYSSDFYGEDEIESWAKADAQTERTRKELAEQSIESKYKASKDQERYIKTKQKKNSHKVKSTLSIKQLEINENEKKELEKKMIKEQKENQQRLESMQNEIDLMKTNISEKEKNAESLLKLAEEQENNLKLLKIKFLSTDKEKVAIIQEQNKELLKAETELQSTQNQACKLMLENTKMKEKYKNAKAELTLIINKIDPELQEKIATEKKRLEEDSKRINEDNSKDSSSSIEDEDNDAPEINFGRK